jgi:hypothetical protein
MLLGPVKCMKKPPKIVRISPKDGHCKIIEIPIMPTAATMNKSSKVWGGCMNATANETRMMPLIISV